MTSNTDLANRALAHVGEQQISDIDDPEVKAARVCKSFLQDIIDETLREHRWNCAIKRVTLSRLSDPPNHGFQHAYQLPGDFIRMLELNGEQFDASTEYFEIEDGKRLLCDDSQADIRYVRRIGVAEMDPLLAKTVSLSLAASICIPLNLNLQMQGQLEVLKNRALTDAQQKDAIEVGSREVRPLMRILGNSPLIRSRFTGRAYRDPLRYYIP